jgi:hypothetical protein
MIDWIVTNKCDSNIYFQCSICHDSCELHKNNEELSNDKCYLFKNTNGTMNEISIIEIGEINDPNLQAYCKTCLDSWINSTLLTGKPCKSPLNNLPMTFIRKHDDIPIELGFNNFTLRVKILAIKLFLNVILYF